MTFDSYIQNRVTTVKGGSGPATHASLIQEENTTEKGDEKGGKDSKRKSFAECISVKTAMQISVGVVVVIMVLFAANYPGSLSGNRRVSNDGTFGVQHGIHDPYRARRNSVPAEEYGIIGRFFCRGRSKGWGCGE